MKLIDNIKKFIYDKAVQYTYSAGYGQPVWRTQKDEQFITEAYYKIVWVYSCVALIASCTSSVEWCLYRRGRSNNNIEIEKHPILDIVNKNE